MDHNETSATGHDVYREGLHVDVNRRSSKEVHLQLSHGSLPPNRGRVIRGCVDYFKREIGYFIDVYEERQAPGGPPKWLDGGDSIRENGADSTCTFISPSTVGEDMSQESPVEDALSSDELTELLADATETTPEEIDQGARDLEIAPPGEATVVDE